MCKYLCAKLPYRQGIRKTKDKKINLILAMRMKRKNDICKNHFREMCRNYNLVSQLRHCHIVSHFWCFWIDFRDITATRRMMMYHLSVRCRARLLARNRSAIFQEAVLIVCHTALYAGFPESVCICHPALDAGSPEKL